MCSPWVIDIVGAALSEEEVRGKTVIEIGSLDVNGSVRPHAERLGAATYVGIDVREGPRVDVVCDAAEIDRRFGPDAFDIVISTELIEHVRDWRRIVHNFKYTLRPHGLLVVTTRSYGVDFHRHPFDFWRYEKEDFESIFSDLVIEDLQRDPTSPGLFLKARKPEPFTECDLSDYALYSILRQRRKSAARDVDILMFHIRYRLIRLLMDLLPRSYRQDIHARLLR